MRIKNRRWLFACGFHLIIICATFRLQVDAEEIHGDASDQNNSPPLSSRSSVFSPRMDYDQWKPLGRGDPLKNDPTYDYVPPKLDRVHYWVDTTPRKPEPDPQKTEILVLGVSSKKPATGTSKNVNSRTDYDTIIKFLDGTKLGQNVKSAFQRQRPPHYSVPVTYFSSSQMYSANSNKNTRPHHERINYSKGEQQRVPYTMLVPPPMPSASRPQEMRPFKQQPIPASASSTTPAAPTSTPLPFPHSNSSVNSTSVTVQESKLVYQSSSLSVADEWQKGNTITKETVPSSTLHVPIIWNSTVQKNKASPIPLVLAPESFIQKEQHPKPNENSISISEVFEDSLGSDTTVMEQHRPEEPPMRKGQVTDESMDISNTYVNIGKPDAQIQASNVPEVTNHSVIQDVPMTLQAMQTMQAMETMQTMQPPPVMPPMMANFSKLPQPMMPPLMANFSKLPQPMMPMKPMLMLPNMKPMHMPTSLHALLQKEITPAAPITTFRPLTAPVIPSTTTTPMPPPMPQPTTTTPQPALTTDTLFKHYKQPVEPIKGPMYLIIQGHSKVKTYGPAKSVHGIQVQETNEIPTAEEDQKGLGLSAYSLQDHLNNFAIGDENGRQGKEIDVMEESDNAETKTERQAKAYNHGGLRTLNHAIQAGLGAIGVPLDRKDDNIDEAEFVDQEKVARLSKELNKEETEDEETRKGKEIEKQVKLNGLSTLLHVVQSGLGAINVTSESKEVSEGSETEQIQRILAARSERAGREGELKPSKLLEALTFKFQDLPVPSEGNTNFEGGSNLENKSRKGRSKRLQSIEVPSSVGNASAKNGGATVPLERKNEDVQETEFVVKYNVASSSGEESAPTSERYFKGIVEAGDMSRKLH